MAIIRIKKADAIAFQLVKKELTRPGAQWEEEQVVIMSPKPSIIRYSYGTRSAVTQTVPDMGFIDRYGSRLTTVFMAGTFGIQVRRVGIKLKDGYTRFLDFRDEIFKKSQDARAKTLDNRKFVYAVNFYDFINDERFAVNLNQFDPQIDAKYNAIENTYQLSFMSIGPIFRVIPVDPTLQVLLLVDWLITEGNAGLNDALAWLRAAPVISQIVTIADLIASGIDIAGQVSANLQILGTLYGSAVAGQVSTLTSPSQSLGQKAIAVIKG